MFDFKLQPAQVSKAALLTGAALVLSAVSSVAHAQGFNVDTKSLPQVKSHVARQKWQIVREDPEITDVRPVDEPAKKYQVIIPALPGGAGGASQSVTVLTPKASNLPQSRYSSNIPANGMGVNRNLPGVEQSHLGKQMAAEAKAAKAVSARPIGQPGAKPIAASKTVAPVGPATYQTMYKTGGQAGSAVSTSSKVVGVVTRKDLLGR